MEYKNLQTTYDGTFYTEIKNIKKLAAKLLNTSKGNLSKKQFILFYSMIMNLEKEYSEFLLKKPELLERWADVFLKFN